MADPIPVPTEADYLDAAKVYRRSINVLLRHTDEQVAEAASVIARDPDFRAAVDSAYAAGWRAHAAQTRKALPMCNNGEVVMVTDMAAYLRGRRD